MNTQCLDRLVERLHVKGATERVKQHHREADIAAMKRKLLTPEEVVWTTPERVLTEMRSLDELYHAMTGQYLLPQQND